jgi:DNA-binding NarL/FixJ family response regulator
MSTEGNSLCDVSPIGTPPDLTSREHRVLESVWAGYSTRAIALALKVDLRVIEADRNSLMSKFGVNNSMELVRWRCAIEFSTCDVSGKAITVLKSLGVVPCQYF